MTERVDENLKKMHEESFFVDEMGKKLKEASSAIEKLEKKIPAVSDDFAVKTVKI
jgi:predicted translin family RNA/ssDNA-binding protein